MLLLKDSTGRRLYNTEADLAAGIRAKEIVEVNIGRLNIFEDNTEVTEALLKERGIVSKTLDGVKILGNGTLEKSLTVKVSRFSKSAIEKIEAAGGKVEVI